jgi:signal transduction histidine kinase
MPRIELVIDVRGAVIEGAAAWQRYTGVATPPVWWSDLLVASPVEQRARLARLWGDALSTRTPFAVRVLVFSRVARRPVPCMLRVSRTAEPAVWSVALYECAEAEADPRVQVSDLDEARLEEVVQTVVRGLAHRLNAGLHAAAGHAGLIAAAAPSAPLRTSAEHIARAARQMSDTFAALSACSSTTPTALSFVDLGACLTAWQEDLHKLGVNGATLEVLTAESCHIRADEQLVHEAVKHLVDNAMEAAVTRGGHVRVRCGVASLDSEALALARPACHAHPGTYAFVAVEDDGGGIAAHHMQHVFDPFFSTRFLGRGLGLPTVLASMRRMGGLVLLESTPDAGTVARLLFPSASEHARPRPPATQPEDTIRWATAPAAALPARVVPRAPALPARSRLRRSGRAAEQRRRS